MQMPFVYFAKLDNVPRTLCVVTDELVVRTYRRVQQ